MSQTLKLKGFAFPEKLPGGRANFRIVFDVRYWVVDGKKAALATATSINPGIDTYWECDPDRRGSPNYRRKGDSAEIDMATLDAWDLAVITLDTPLIHSVRAKVFDVDREDLWDKVRDIAGDLVSVVAGVGRTAAVAAVPSAVGKVTGDAADELTSYLVKKLAGGNDKVLFQGSAGPKGKDITISGSGTDGKGGQGTYTIVLEIIDEKAPTLT